MSRLPMAGQQDRDLRRAAEQVWKALDHLAENDPEEYKKFIDQQMKEGAEAQQHPEPVFCLRCDAKLRGNSQKLFVNVCKWSKLPRPKTDVDPIPVKGGVLRHLVKKGKRVPPLLFDLAFNPYVTDQCGGTDPVLYEMLVSLTIQFIADATGVEVDPSKCERLSHLHKGPLKDIHNSLDENFNHLLPPESRLDVGQSILDALQRLNSQKDTRNCVLPPLKLPGDVQGNPEKPLIQELPDRLGKAGGKELHTDVCSPTHLIDVCEREVKVSVNLPGVSSVAEVDLEISKDDFRLEVEERFFLVEEFPLPVDDSLVKATFNKTSSQLIFKVPVLSRPC